MTQTTFCRRRNMMEMRLAGRRLTSDPQVTICVPCRLCCLQGTIVPQWRNWLKAVHAACEVTELLNACPLTRLVIFAEECIACTNRSPGKIAEVLEVCGHFLVYSHGIRMSGWQMFCDKASKIRCYSTHNSGSAEAETS